MTKSLYEKAKEFLTGVQPAVPEGAAPAVVWDDLINAFIGAVITYIRGCAGGASTASARIKEGGAVSYVAALKIVKQQAPDLRGKARQAKAHELVAKGKDLTDEELADLCNQAKDIPIPSAPVGLWPMAILLCLCVGSATFAQDGPKGLWPVDEEQNVRLDKLEGEAAKIQSSFRTVQGQLDEIKNRLPAPVVDPRPVVDASAIDPVVALRQGLAELDARLDKLAAKQLPSPQKQVASSKVAAALNHSPAFEMHNGVMTHTSDAHLLHHGYKPADFAGLTPDQKDRLHGAAHGTGQLVAGSQLRQEARQQVAYETQCNGRSCRRVRRRG